MKNNFWNNTFIYGLGFLLLRGISFFLLPIYTNLLSEYDAGIIFLIYTLLAFLNPVYAYGMNASLFKFYNDKNYNHTETITTSLVSLFFSSSLLSLLLIIFSNYLNPIIGVDAYYMNYKINWFVFLSCILFFDSFSSRAIVLLRLQKLPFYFLFISSANIILSLMFNFLFIYKCNFSSFGAVLSILCVSAIQTILLSPIIIKSIDKKFFNFSLFKKMFSFAMPFLPSALLFVVIGFSDRWFIKYFLNMESVGLYGAGYKLGSLMSLAVTAFNLNWQPYYLDANNKKHFGKIGSIAIVGFIAVYVLLLIFVDTIVQLNWGGVYLVGKSFWEGIAVVPYVALGYFFYGIYILQMPSIFLLNKQKWGLIFWFCGALVNIVGNIILIPLFGILGASFSTALGYFVMMVFLIYKNFSWLKINYNYKIIIWFSLLSFLLLTLFYWFDSRPFVLFLGAIYFIYALQLVLKIQNNQCNA